MQILSLAFRLLLALLVGALVAWYFGIIMPAGLAAVVGIAAGIAEFFGLGGGGGRGHGAGLRIALRAGLPLLSWPAFVLIARAVGVHDAALAVALAAIPAAASGVFTPHRGQGREQGYLIAIMIASAVPLFAFAGALHAGSVSACAAAAAAAAAACGAARLAQVWSDEASRLLLAGCGIAAAGALATAARALVF